MISKNEKWILNNFPTIYNKIYIPYVHWRIKHYGLGLIKILIKLKNEHLKEKAFKELKKMFLNFRFPNTGKYEKEILDNIEKKHNIIIARQFCVDNYYLDGYCVEENIAFEVDEKHHFRNGKLKKKDILRENYIKNKLGCTFVRIKSK